MCLGSQINSRLLWCARLAPAAMDDAALAKLEKLAEMKSKGILTEEEFAQQKAAVLGGSGNASNQVAPAPEMMMQPIMMQPGMMGNQRPPPPGCPPGGQFLMVKYKGPVTEQAQQHHSSTCCIIGTLFLPAMGAGIICCLLAACPPPDLKDEKEVYQVGGTYYTLNGTVDTNVGGPAPMPPTPIDVDPATAARLAELINRSVGVWKSSPTVSTNKHMTLTQTFELRPLSNGFHSTVMSTTGKNCCGCSDRRLTFERHGKVAADGTSYTMQGISGLIHGALTSYDTDSNVATYSFNGPGASGTFMIDGHRDRMTNHSKTKGHKGHTYEFKFEFRR